MSTTSPSARPAVAGSSGARLRLILEGIRETVTGGGRPSALLSRALLVTLAALLLFLAFAVVQVISIPQDGQALALSDVLTLAQKDEVISARFLDEDASVVGTSCTKPRDVGHCPGSIESFHASYLHSDAATAQLLEAVSKPGVTASVDPQVAKARLRFVMTFVLPLLILANVFGLIFVGRGGQGGIADIVNFGGIGDKRGRKGRATTGVTFGDVAGADEAVTELREVRDYLLDPGRYKTMGAQPPKGVLLLGPPGCGKTLLARAVAGEAAVPFFSMSGAEFVESLVGVGAARVRDLFRRALEAAPAIIFIDELDAAARRRGVGGGQGGSDEREQTLNQMLVAMDGFEVTSGVVVMAATNRPDILDPALLRPGRFDRHVTVDEPDVSGREAILGLHARNKPMAPDVDIARVAQQTPGFTGADLANVVNEATLLAIREGRRQISSEHIVEAVQRVIGGPRRRGRLMSDQERQRVAFHEAGHALVAAALGHGAQVHRISVVARGRGLGQSAMAAGADRVLLTRTELEDELTIVMAGSAAEELRLGETSTTAESDIEKASDLARQMVGRYGMSPALGPVRLVAKDSDLYLAGEAHALVTISPEMQAAVDREVKTLIERGRARAVEILSTFSSALDTLAGRLARVENLEGDALAALLAPVVPGRGRKTAAASRRRSGAGAPRSG